MTTFLEPTEKDFGQMMGFIMGFFQTQIAGAIANYSIADHLAKGSATAGEIATKEGIDPQATFRRLRACASLGLVNYDGTRFTATPLLGTLRRDVPGSLHSLAAARELGLSNRSTAVPSNFFEHVPTADLYLLKHVLHDWNDDESVSILKRCRESIRPGGKIMVIEILLGEVGEPALGPLMDLNMMIMCTGRERALDEYRGLIEKAGFRFSKVKPIRPPMVVIEATP
jgi:hypothetical protein